ncbi:hypothetical protein [Lichenicola sp.]|uniref:hypothetical protein n=1 Tax=Lichenicola sp. TaxID=2804529 RepID=UPI003AFFC33D
MSMPVGSVAQPGSDDAVRQALLRLGSGARPDQRQDAQGRTAQSGRPVVRRRFVQDGEVAVEYAERPRQPAQPVQNNAAVLDQLREELARERQTRTEAEAAVRELKLSLQTCQTRVAHLEMALEEARAVPPPFAAAPVQDEPMPAPDAPRPVRRQYVRKVASTDAAPEPEPVKWWIKSK